jgi:lipid-binding SYLF domain-containing protein
MRNILIFGIMLFLMASPAFSQNREKERLQECAAILKEMLNMPEDVPQDLLDRAECVVVIPSVMKLAVGIGGSYGRGAVVCRSGKDFNGPGH